MTGQVPFEPAKRGGVAKVITIHCPLSNWKFFERSPAPPLLQIFLKGWLSLRFPGYIYPFYLVVRSRRKKYPLIFSNCEEKLDFVHPSCWCLQAMTRLQMMGSLCPRAWLDLCLFYLVVFESFFRKKNWLNMFFFFFLFFIGNKKLDTSKLIFSSPTFRPSHSYHIALGG